MLDANRPDAPGTDAFVPDAFVSDAFVSDSGIDAYVADTGHDAAAPIDAGIDAGTDAGHPGDTACATTFAGAIVCDGFESEPGPWTGRTETMGVVTTDGMQAVRGTRALHARITGAGGQAAREAEALGPFTSGDLWIRISAYVPSTATLYDFTWLSIGEVVAPYAGISLGLGGSDVGSYSSISGTYVSDASLTIARDTWTCLELHVVVSDTVGVIEVYREGTLAASHTGIDTNPGGGFTRFAVGIDYADPMQGATETFLDEVVLSRTRHACP
jgi:hypothetical protein